MSDDKEGGYGTWGEVPVWDGSPMTWRAFKREMSWWLSSLDLESTKKYNLAASWLLRQSGTVRQRREEFTPAELAYQKAVEYQDPETGETLTITPEDPLAGMNKLFTTTTTAATTTAAAAATATAASTNTFQHIRQKIS